MKLSALLALAISLPMVAVPAAGAVERPNFVWIVSEDNSVHYLRHFFEGGSPAPNIEALAREGLTFDRAYSNGPVCSVARSTLALSCYAPRLAVQFHRKLAPAQLPPEIQVFTYYLRKAGYYCTNNSKTDYNFTVTEKPWDESSNRATWRNRPTPGTPFFHMQSFAVSHESCLHFSQATVEKRPTRTDPATVKVAPYHPDTEIFRYTNAFYRDRMMQVDDIVGKMVAQLREDGLLENTFIFYFGDHGGVLPGSKAFVTDAGLHVPLVVRVPEKWRDRFEIETGSRVSGAVEFVDFGPTVLKLAGVEIPGHMDGEPFLYEGVTPKRLDEERIAFSYADRFDETYDLNRSLHRGKFHYIRSFTPWYPSGLRNNYRYKQLAYCQWRDLYRAGELNEAQRRFFEAQPVERLFDTEADPDEINNLATDPAHRETLLAMRNELTRLMKSLPDTSLYPESVIIDQAVQDPVRFAKTHKQEIGELINVADLALVAFEEARPRLEKALTSDNRWKRYWGLVASASHGPAAGAFTPTARKLFNDDEPLVRLRAAEFLGLWSVERPLFDPRETFRGILAETSNPATALLTLHAAVYFQDHASLARPFEVDAESIRARDGQIGRRLEYLSGRSASSKGGRRRRSVGG